MKLMRGNLGGFWSKMQGFGGKIRKIQHKQGFWAGAYMVMLGAVASMPGVADLVAGGGATLERNNTITGKHLRLDKMETPEAGDLTVAESYAGRKVSGGSVMRYASSNTSVDGAAATSGYTISINGRTLDIVSVGNTNVDAGNHVNQIGRLYYGHNYAGVFGDIARAGSFTIVQDGVSRTYTVTAVVTVVRTELDADTHGGHYTHINNLVSTGSLCVNGKYGADECDFCQGMGGYGGAVVLMTCAGTMYGNGDASHRVLVFAS